MGLFSNSKKPCPICGNPTPRLLATKIEGMPICKDCDNKIDLPDGVIDQMTLEDFQQYIRFYDDNQSLRSAFTETACYNYFFLPRNISVDNEHGLFRLNDRDSSMVFEAAALKSFRIWEDRSPLFEGDGEALRCYESDAPDRARDMEELIDRFMREVQEHERMERMERMMEHHDRRDDRNPPPPRPYIPEPRFAGEAPVRRFRVEIAMEHPYWPGLVMEWRAPDFDSRRPSIGEYLEKYHEVVEGLYALACGLMSLLNPQAQEVRVSLAGNAAPTAAQAAAAQTAAVAAAAAAAVSAAAGDPVAEIQKYKMLLDAGVITDEEFTAKKRQLLGI